MKNLSRYGQQTTMADVLATDRAHQVMGTTPVNGKENEGLGELLYNRNAVTLEEAQSHLWKGETIWAIETSAADYRKVFFAMGATEVKVWSDGSSAGDWDFIIRYEGLWYPAYQVNEWPRGGFTYGVSIRECFDDYSDITTYLRQM